MPRRDPLLFSSFCVLQVALIVFIFELTQLLDELVDPVVARQRACVFLEHYRLCELIVMLRLLSW